MSLSTSFWQLVTAASSALSGLPTAIAGQTAMPGSSREQLGSPSPQTESLIDSMLDDQHLVLVFEMLGRRDLLCRAACVSKRWCVLVPQCCVAGHQTIACRDTISCHAGAVDLIARRNHAGPPSLKGLTCGGAAFPQRWWQTATGLRLGIRRFTAAFMSGYTAAAC